MVTVHDGKRVSKADTYLNCAEVFACRSTCLKRKYGAVIVKDDVVISTGYNGSPRGKANCCDIGECIRVRAMPVVWRFMLRLMHFLIVPENKRLVLIYPAKPCS